MAKFLLRFFALAAALGLTAVVVPGIHFEGPLPLLAAAAAVGLLNALLRPLLVFFTLPLVLVSLGLFVLVINAGLLMLAAKLVPGFAVEGFWSAVLGSLLVSGLSFILNRMVGGGEERRRQA